MQHESHIETINDLIEINHDRIAGYERAIRELQDTHSSEAIQNFRKYASDSQGYVQQLSQYVQQMGGEPVSSTTIGGKLHRLWMDIKQEFAFHEKESALESCVFGDNAAIKAYEAALQTEDPEELLPPAVRSTLSAQMEGIRKAQASNEAYEEILEEARSLEGARS